jgi:uncharacterized membrane protein HdeD (DUF308 family)
MNTDIEVITLRGTVADFLARSWWLMAIRGLIAVLFGVIAFIAPGVTMLTIVFLFGTFAIANGILSLVVAFKAPKGSRLGGLIFGGIVGIIAGAIAFLVPGLTALSLVILVGAWAIATGVMEIVAAVKLRKVITNEWLLVLAGVASIAFGVIVFFLPTAGALALTWWIGAYAIAFGVLLIILAFKMKHWKDELSVATPRMA